MKRIDAVAISNGKKKEFSFEIEDNATEKEKSDKAFEIAYCRFIDLEEVKIDW